MSLCFHWTVTPMDMRNLLSVRIWIRSVMDLWMIKSFSFSGQRSSNLCSCSLVLFSFLLFFNKLLLNGVLYRTEWFCGLKLPAWLFLEWLAYGNDYSFRKIHVNKHVYRKSYHSFLFQFNFHQGHVEIYLMSLCYSAK
jgi:hypothetical protein